MTNTDTEADDVRPMKEGVRDNLNELQVAPVGGALVTTFAQQIDYAKQMSRGRLSLPDFLAGNVGDCLAVVNMAVRFGFDPYMVAGQTYVQNDRLCFMAQLVHAMIECSGRLSRRLRVEYESEGDDRRCTITGWVKGESEPFSLRSETLGKLRPPPGTTHVDKNGVETKSVKGSPLWIKKPDLQLFYNTSRDWARMYLPEVLMGVYTPDEIEEGIEHRGPDRAIDRGVITALAAAPAAGAEGGNRAGVDRELDEIATGANTAARGEPDPEPIDGAPAAGERTQDAPPQAGAAETAGPDKPRRRSTKKDPKPDPKPEPETTTETDALPAMPTAAAEWPVYARAMIATLKTAAAIETWWGDDRTLRDRLLVPIKVRTQVDGERIDRMDALKKGGGE